MILDRRHHWVLIKNLPDGKTRYSCRVCCKKEDVLLVEALVKRDIEAALAKLMAEELDRMIIGTGTEVPVGIIDQRGSSVKKVSNRSKHPRKVAENKG